LKYFVLIHQGSVFNINYNVKKVLVLGVYHWWQQKNNVTQTVEVSERNNKNCRSARKKYNGKSIVVTLFCYSYKLHSFFLIPPQFLRHCFSAVTPTVLESENLLEKEAAAVLGIYWYHREHKC
jgi:hypothetical protein